MFHIKDGEYSFNRSQIFSKLYRNKRQQCVLGGKNDKMINCSIIMVFVNSYAIFPLILCGLCAQKFWRVCTFSGNSPTIKAVFVSEIRRKQKKRVFTQKWSGFGVGKVYGLSYYCNFMINNKTSVQQYVCAQQIYACAQSLNSVCARTRAQLRGNTAHKSSFYSNFTGT